MNKCGFIPVKSTDAAEFESSDVTR